MSPTGALSLAVSPCPNDTFVFHAWVHGLVDGPRVDLQLADIDVCNTLAVHRGADVVKVSYAALPELLDDYALLPCGGALGRGVGPLVLAREAVDRAELRGRRVVVPGSRTTAYLLLRLWAEDLDLDVDVLPFEQVMPAVRDGRYDAGLVIHESRFTYPSFGLQKVQDLGEWWEAETGLPIPLGAIVARRGLDLDALSETIRASVDAAWADPSASAAWVAEHAQEMAPEVQQAHIDLYVNASTRDIGEEGWTAARELLGRAAARGFVRAVEL